MKRHKSVESQIKKALGAGRSDISIDRDPLSLLFIGIRFRNSEAQAEAVRRVHHILAEKEKKYFDEAAEEYRFRAEMTQRDLADARRQIERLEQSIRQIKRNQAEEVIDAITRNPMVVASTEGLVPKVVGRG